MVLNKIKPIIEELNGISCVVVEKQIDAQRAEFLKKLLVHNRYTVIESTNENGSITLGVTDLLFNPVLDVYKRRLISLTNRKVTPDYWMQASSKETIDEVTYWSQKR
jgi:hypothetical protein